MRGFAGYLRSSFARSTGLLKEMLNKPVVGIVDLNPAAARSNLVLVDWAAPRYGAASLEAVGSNGATHVSDDWEALVPCPAIDIIIEALIPDPAGFCPREKPADRHCLRT